MIHINKVSKQYGAFRVLDDCTTSVARGEVVVVCGSSGSGKSTLIKCVNGLEPFQAGAILEDASAEQFFAGAQSERAQQFLSRILTH
jgi:glutamate/aspartate transport system ATP-binding protein